MIRNLKALGLALVAVVALSAFAASTASAGQLTSDGPVTLDGTQTPIGNPTANNRLTAFGGNTLCPNATYTGHKVLTHAETTAGKTHELIPSGATKVTIKPDYGSCTALGFPATVDMNGCDYEFEIGTVTNHVASVNAYVVCPEGKDITLRIYSGAGKHTANEPFCHITIKEKATAYTGLTATGTTTNPDDIDITGTVTGIEATKSSPTGSILCPHETTTTASLDQDITVTGTDGQGNPTGITIS